MPTLKGLPQSALFLLALVAGCSGDGPVAPAPGIPAVTDPAATPQTPPSPDPQQPKPQGAVAGIYIANADGSNITLVAHGYRPSWSPDGKRLVFGGLDGVHVIDVAGENDLLLAEGGGASWSPDGRRIAFANRDGIAVMDADGSNIKLLVRHDFRTDTYAPWDMGVSYPAWSPDGSHIAFQHNGDGDIQPGQIYIMNADGTGLRRGTDPGNGRRYAESDAAWTPDGANILFWSYGTGISYVAADGGRPWTAYAPPGAVWGSRPTQAPNGTIAATVRDWMRSAADIWIASPAQPPRILISNGYDSAFSPDGTKIAFTRN